MAEGSLLRGCPVCAQVQRIPPLGRTEVARCVRCDARLAAGRVLRDPNRRAWHATCAALMLYPLAVALPILRIERLGHAQEKSVLAGSLGLVSEGEVLLGLVVFTCSIVIPLAKLGTLALLLARPGALLAARRAQAWHALELAGRWGMLDVLLVSILVAWLQLGSFVVVTPGPAAVAFAACVLLSLLAGAWFDPQALWRPAADAERAR